MKFKRGEHRVDWDKYISKFYEVVHDRAHVLNIWKKGMKVVVNFVNRNELDKIINEDEPAVKTGNV